MFYLNSKYRILISFGMVMVLMVMVAGTGLLRLTENNQRMETIVDEYNVKTSHIVTMYTAARDRSVSLLRMVHLDDPFARDDEYLYFNKLAAKFARARIALSGKPLDDQELKFHTEQGKLTSEAVPLQELVVELLAGDDIKQATRVLLEEAIPAQDRVLAQLVEMLNYEQVSARRAMDESKQAYRETVVFISILSAAAIAVGVLVAVLVMRRTSQTENVLSQQVDQERKLRKQLSYQASHDALTGLINRFEFENQLKRILENTGDEQTTHALMYLDLDQFNVVNDTCGHVAGDELLRQLSSVLKHTIRSHDILARLGGDEFGVLLEHCAPECTVSVANTLLDTVQEFRFVWEDKSFVIGASIGVVIIDSSSNDMADILSAADAACYSAKDAGRNRVHVVGENDTAIANRYGEMQWVTRITDALEHDKFRLFYQHIVPIDGARNAQPELIEILVRMQDESGKLIPPGAFIPAAERYNLMVSLDRWVTRATFDWLMTNPEARHVGKCSINLSGQSIGDPRFLEYLMDLIVTSGVPAEKVCFEITETSAITNLSEARRFMTELKSIGCWFALDDFGSGLSSFAYLKNLPVDYLKIDGTFVRDIVKDPIDQAMVRSINEIGRVMGKKTIAEFVENEQILNVLRDIGVDYVQGIGIEKPLNLSEFASDHDAQRPVVAAVSSL
jgi:diguanylate cyclase (GGDEF)-like protein